MFFVLVAVVVQAVQLPGMLVERRLAEDLPARLGDTLQVTAIGSEAAPRSFVVEGIFERPADPSRISRNEYEVRFHLPDLEAMQPTSDRVDRFAVVLRSGSDPEDLGRWVESLAFGTQAYEASSLADQSSTTFRVVSRFHDAIGLVTLLASGIFLLCLMVIRVDERRADVRTMRLVGISRRTILRTVVLESVAVAALASLGGILLGAMLTWGVNRYYANFYDTTLRFALLTPRIVLLALGLGILLGASAGTLAALRLVNVAPQRLGER